MPATICCAVLSVFHAFTSSIAPENEPIKLLPTSFPPMTREFVFEPVKLSVAVLASSTPLM